MPSNFGRPLLTLSLGDLVVSEHLHAPHEQIGLHRHEQPYMCIVTAGAYSEISRSRTLQLKEGAVLGHPEGEQHANSFGADGGRCLNITPQGAWRDNAAWSDWLQDRAAAPGSAGPAAMMRLKRELMANPHPFSIAAALFELMAGDADRCRQGPVPAWLRRVREGIDAAPSAAHGLTALAGEAGVHPSHLAKAFRQWTGQSIGEYARRQRIEAALEEIGHAPLAEIAARHGFSDQAHFTRAVRQATGLTPRAFKKARQVQ
ncbi:helix-turn-helix transcriptional regulator [Massilia endophytica]|uniref:helix-turn-helix transcriptional regulator n=1 Tax=Massilia endophytica TaxID=2899220 RepID=UPI001E41FA2A|nr:helix-turn-helix transcriptional regulator [Massilia endophytica]UGQ49027.1 helix-turn-helix transcriptional regulator [Massilia endophytica]